jgi:hypothetical protein
MMDAGQINLEDLEGMYRRQGRAGEAAGIMDSLRGGKSRINLGKLLRFHGPEPILSEREIRQRDSFDFLIAFYSILEIASIIKFVPEPVPQPQREHFQFDLSQEAVKLYYEKHYPLVLPRLFRQRLEGKRRVSESGADERAQSIFTAFLSLEGRAREDEDVEMFLWFLDSGSSDDFDLSDTMETLLNQRKFLDRIVKAPAKQDSLDMSLHGFRKMLAICADLDALLQRAAAYPLLQSAMWRYYEYWFDHIGKQVGSDLKRAVGNFLEWAPEKPSKKATKEIRAYVDEVNAVVDRLTSGMYGEALKAGL